MAYQGNNPLMSLFSEGDFLGKVSAKKVGEADYRRRIGEAMQTASDAQKAEATAFLEQQLTDPGSEAVQSVAYALGQMGARGAVPALVSTAQRCLGTEGYENNFGLVWNYHEILGALRQLGAVADIEALEEKSWGNMAIRLRSAISGIGQSPSRAELRARYDHGEELTLGELLDMSDPNNSHDQAEILYLAAQLGDNLPPKLQAALRQVADNLGPTYHSAMSAARERARPALSGH